MRPAAAALAFVASCHATEHRPPEWDPPPRALVSAGCLELTAAVMVDGVGKVPGIPVRISFHSTCKESVLLDLRRVRVLARLDAGEWTALVPYDPERAMRTGLLAAGDGGDEPIEYQAPAGALAAWNTVCINLDAVRPDADPVAGAVVCFDRTGRILAIDGPDSADGGAP
jgi:hypothetical protein